MLREDALKTIYPELEERIVVTIMGAVAASYIHWDTATTFFILSMLWDSPRRWAWESRSDA